MCRLGIIAAYSWLFLISGTSHAYAYLDPGTGSMLLQGLIAAIAGGIVALRLYWTKVKKLFTREHPKSDGNKKSDVA